MSESNEHKSKKETTKIGAVIVLIISAIVFLPAGGVAVYQGLFNKDKTPVFGSYAGKKIKYEPNSKFVNAASNIKNQYQQSGYEINSKAYYYIYNQAFNQTLINMAFTDLVEKSGYKVPETAINRQLISLPYFNDENGKFSEKLFNQASDNDISTLRSDIQDSLAYYRFVDDVFGSTGTTFNGQKIYGLKYSSKESDFINAMGSEKHSFELVSFSTNNYPESEAVKYGKENAELFTKYDISAITTETEKEAKAILKQLKSGELTFEDALNDTRSQKYYTTGDGKLASPYRYQLSDMLFDEENIPELLSIEKNTYSNPIQTKMGYTIFKTDSDPVAADFSDSTVIDVVMTYLNNNEKGFIEEYFTSIAKDFATEAAVSSFDRACRVFDLEKVTTEPFPINYGNSSLYGQTASVSELSGLSSNADLLKKAFALKENELSEPFVVEDKILVLKCTGIQKNEVPQDNLDDKLNYMDQTSLQQTLMASDKVVNNFMSTYIQYFMQADY